MSALAYAQPPPGGKQSADARAKTREKALEFFSTLRIGRPFSLAQYTHNAEDPEQFRRIMRMLLSHRLVKRLAGGLLVKTTDDAVSLQRGYYGHRESSRKSTYTSPG